MVWTHRRTHKEDASLIKQRILSGIPAVIGAAAFICSYVGNFFCNNVQFAPEGDFSPEDPYRPRTITYGLWMYKELRVSNQYNGDIIFAEYCSGYEEGTEFNTEWSIARAFSCLGMLAAGILLLWQCFAPFLLFDALYWRWAMVLFALIGGCQTATLFFLYSNACYDNVLVDEMTNNPSLYPSECSWDWGALVQLSSAVLYFCTAASFCFIPAPGMRPNERRFPMMVWNSDDSSVQDADSFALDDDEDDDSIDSFACDYEEEKDVSMVKRQTPEDLTETEVSQTGYGEDEEDFTLKEVKMDSECTERCTV